MSKTVFQKQTKKRVDEYMFNLHLNGAREYIAFVKQNPSYSDHLNFGLSMIESHLSQLEERVNSIIDKATQQKTS